MYRPLTAIVLLSAMAGCARVPIYLEPAGHSTTYRLHAEHHDRLYAPTAFDVTPVSAQAEPLPPPDSVPPTPLPPLDNGVDAWSSDDASAH